MCYVTDLGLFDMDSYSVGVVEEGVYIDNMGPISLCAEKDEYSKVYSQAVKSQHLIWFHNVE